MHVNGRSFRQQLTSKNNLFFLHIPLMASHTEKLSDLIKLLQYFLLTDRRLRSWLFGAVLTTWSSTCSKHWRWSWTSGKPPCSPPLTIMNSTDCSGVIQVPGHHHLPGPEVGQSHWVHCEKAQQRLYFLCQLRKFNLPQELLIKFYSTITESVLCKSITVWFSSATKSDLRRLRRVVRTAERIIGTTLPTLQELYLSRVSKSLAKSLWTPHIQHLPYLNCYVWSTLQSSENQNEVKVKVKVCLFITY